MNKRLTRCSSLLKKVSKENGILSTTLKYVFAVEFLSP